MIAHSINRYFLEKMYVDILISSSRSYIFSFYGGSAETKEHKFHPQTEDESFTLNIIIIYGTFILGMFVQQNFNVK